MPYELVISGHREQWEPGDRSFFEYRCYEGYDSADVELWYRSHQEVMIITMNSPDIYEYSTAFDRRENGVPLTYLVCWDDGFQSTVWEDELLIGPEFYIRDDPPTDAMCDS